MQAEFRKTERQKLLNENPNVNILTKNVKDFISYFENFVAEKVKKVKSSSVWKAALMQLKNFTGGKLLFIDVTADFAQRFQDYLRFDAELSQNSARLYFRLFSSAVLKAVKRKEIPLNPLADIETIPAFKASKEFLTIEELQVLAKTETTIPDVIRRAALFSSLTGLRFIDIQRLKWSNVRKTEDDILLVLRIKKTDDPTIHYISQEALNLLGEQRNPDDLVFENLIYTSTLNGFLNEWTTAAGIDRKITFHCFRHSFASAHLRSGTSIEDISELLTHSNIATTQIYLHSLGHRKRKLAGKISLK